MIRALGKHFIEAMDLRQRRDVARGQEGRDRRVELIGQSTPVLHGVGFPKERREVQEFLGRA